MITSFFGWLRGLSLIGKAAVTIVGLGAVTAMAAPAPANPNVAPDTSQGQVQGKASEPVVTKEILTETQSVPFGKKTVETPLLNKGESRITTNGVNGAKTVTYEITKTDGTETNRVTLSEVVSQNPVDEVTSIGTYVEPAPVSSCDPNYAGACVPIASDVDCGGGSGNGPAYVYGTVRVIGYDIYDLDRDGDGYGCE